MSSGGRTGKAGKVGKFSQSKEEYPLSGSKVLPGYQDLGTEAPLIMTNGLQIPVAAAEQRRRRRAAVGGTFRTRLRALMDQHGYTQSDLTVASGLSRSAINSYLAGETVPAIDALFAVAEVFGVSADHLLGRRPPRGGRR